MDEAGVWSEWAWWGGGWGLVAIALAVAGLALFRDRARGRLRCSSCWYDMRGGGLTCPECGKTVASAWGLKRTRRRWKMAAAACVPAFVGVQVADWPNRAWEDGWTKFVPTTALAFMARPGMFGGDLSTREEAVRDALMSRPMRSWQAAIAEWRALRVAPEDRAAMVTTRNVWPAGEPVVLRADAGVGVAPLFEEGSLEISAQGRTRAMTLGPSGECGCGCCCGDDELGEEWDDRLVLAGRQAGRYVERVTVRVKSRGWTIARWTVEVGYEVKGTIDDVVAPMSGATVDAGMRAALRMEEYAVETGVMYALWVDTSGDGEEGNDGVCGGLWASGGSMALQGEVLVDGQVVAKLHRGGSFRVVWDDYEETQEPLKECLVRVARPAEGAEQVDPDPRATYAREHVRLRLMGDQRRTLQEGVAGVYWAGACEVSLGELLEREKR